MMQNMSPEMLLRITHLEDIEREQKAVRRAQQTSFVSGLRRRHHRPTR